jgi:hypothetical protein
MIKVAASTDPIMDASESAGLRMAVIDRAVATAAPLVVQNCAVYPLFKDRKRFESRVGSNSVQTFIGVPLRRTAAMPPSGETAYMAAAQKQTRLNESPNSGKISGT